jgi:hypothetical protein
MENLDLVIVWLWFPRLLALAVIVMFMPHRVD